MKKAQPNYDPEDEDCWSDNPLYHLMKQEPVELTENNTCPCCNGKGFVKIVVERKPKGR